MNSNKDLSYIINKIISMKNGEYAFLEDLIGTEMDNFELMLLGNAIEAELASRKVMLKFADETESPFQCKYKQRFQKLDEVDLSIYIIYPKRGSLYKVKDDIVETYNIHINKKNTVKASLLFNAKKNQFQRSVDVDHSSDSFIDIDKLFGVINQLVADQNEYDCNDMLLSKKHFGRIIIELNSHDYIFKIKDKKLNSLKEILRYEDIHNELMIEKEKTYDPSYLR